MFNIESSNCKLCKVKSVEVIDEIIVKSFVKFIERLLVHIISTGVQMIFENWKKKKRNCEIVKRYQCSEQI